MTFWVVVLAVVCGLLLTKAVWWACKGLVRLFIWLVD
jgi:hypothetical protein